jgi:hypothetical protein
MPVPIRDLTGSTSGTWTVTDGPTRLDGSTYWEATCSRCGSVESMRAQRISRHLRSGTRLRCKTCSPTLPIRTGTGRSAKVDMSSWTSPDGSWRYGGEAPSVRARRVVVEHRCGRQLERSAQGLRNGGNPRCQACEPLSYAGAHGRVAAERGPAAEYVCAAVDCDQRATDWAWIPLPGDVSRRSAPERPASVDPARRSLRTYSTSTAAYAPLCRAHHHALDHHTDQRPLIVGIDWAAVIRDGHQRQLDPGSSTYSPPTTSARNLPGGDQE